MLDNRKKRVLQAIVEEYVNNAEPVSSGAIVKKHDLQCSSATIRNDMAELEQIGLLDKPHTSAGRVPSSKGYRFYVDELLKDDDISIEEIRYIKSKLEMRVNALEELTKLVANTLTEVTHYTSLAIGPKTNMHNIEDIKFVLLGSRILMAVILTDAGVIKETIIKLDEDVTEDKINALNIIFNTQLRGKPLNQISKPMEDYLLNEMNYQLKIMKPIIEQINKVISENQNVYLEGADKVFDFPEFREVSTAKNFLSMIDTRDFIENIIDSGVANNINVYIGNENKSEILKDFSIVTFKHVLDGKDLGTIGIIGPTRMDYSKVISIMKYISKQLNDI